MFRGASSLSLDAKGRLAMPSKYRQRLQSQGDGQLVVTRSLTDECLWIYPMQKWEVIERDLDRLPNMKSAVRKLQQVLIGNAHECELDGHGRILVPPLLREFANLEKRVMLVGQLKKFELWNEDVWQEQNSGSLLSGTESENLKFVEELGSLSL